jgi:hypothetical protein
MLRNLIRNLQDSRTSHPSQPAQTQPLDLITLESPDLVSFLYGTKPNLGISINS